ncbi:MAG: universal stress protein, partial [Actinomycetaceae bacterium]|nr:universal stress protein [Actinomycetaceae bacterium]
MAYIHENVVVCGIDASAESRNALIWAAHEAQVRSARLDIVCAYEEPTFSSHIGTSEGSIDLMLAEELLAQAKASVAQFGVEVTTQAVAEDPVSMLVERSKKVARIVLGSRGDGKRRRAKRILGSVASAVTAHSCCAVVVVPMNEVTRVLPVGRIVCGVDGSEASRGALRLAVREASRWGAELSCINSVNFGGNS